MKKCFLLFVSLFLLNGCAATQTIQKLETQNGQDVFKVVKTPEDQPPKGFGDLHISLNLKTRRAGTIVFNTTGYGTERYNLLIGVHNQTQKVVGTMTPETGEYRGSHDPEAGNGVRYRFATTLRLPVGQHRLVFALPGDKVVLEYAVTIEDGTKMLVLKPIYSRKSSHRLLGFYGDRTFYEGIHALTVVQK